jgi:hypothetical protein
MTVESLYKNDEQYNNPHELRDFLEKVKKQQTKSAPQYNEAKNESLSKEKIADAYIDLFFFWAQTSDMDLKESEVFGSFATDTEIRIRIKNYLLSEDEQDARAINGVREEIYRRNTSINPALSITNVKQKLQANDETVFQEVANDILKEQVADAYVDLLYGLAKNLHINTNARFSPAIPDEKARIRIRKYILSRDNIDALTLDENDDFTMNEIRSTIFDKD